MIEELKFLEKFTKKKFRGGGGVGGGGGLGRGGVGGGLVGVGESGWWGGQGGCERRIKVFVKIQKKKKGGVWGGGLGEGSVLGGSGWM